MAAGSGSAAMRRSDWPDLPVFGSPLEIILLPQTGKWCAHFKMPSGFTSDRTDTLTFQESLHGLFSAKLFAEELFPLLLPTHMASRRHFIGKRL